MHQAARTAASVRSPLYDAARVDQGIDRCRLILALVRLLLLMFRFFFSSLFAIAAFARRKKKQKKTKKLLSGAGECKSPAV